MNCPLCHKILLEVDADVDRDPNIKQPFDYFCQTRVKFEGKVSESHYTKRYQEPEQILIPPYRISNYDNSNETTIDIADGNYDGYKNFKRTTFKHILTVPKLHLDTPENLLKRINLLITFS